MASILVWALIIATIAIVSMLALLIASEREVKRQRLEIASLKTRLESAGPAVAGQAKRLIAGESELSAELASLIEQLRFSEVSIATMQCELEALRAENSWLKQERAAHPPQKPTRETSGTDTITAAQVQQGNVHAGDYRLDLGPHRTRLIFPIAAAALSLMALVSVFFAAGRPTFAPARPAESRTGAQSNLAKASATDAANLRDEKHAVEAASKTPPSARILDTGAAPASKRANPPAGTSYEVVRSTRVFSEPKESSRPVARIEAGTEVNVVGAQDDWLEVRSRHGRPPGFIRKEAVVPKSLR
jgi:hypothetical protein